jgi:integrase
VSANITGHVEQYVDRDGKPVRNRWRLVVDFGRVDGKRKREVRRFDGGKKEADAELARWLTELRRAPGAGYVSDGTVGAWLDEWLERFVVPKARDGERAGSTLVWYRGKVRLYLKPELGDVPLKKLTAEHVMDLYEKMGRSKKDGGYGVSARTREATHVALRAALGKALELGRVRVNVLEKGRGVDRPSNPHEHKVSGLDENQLVALLGNLATAEGKDGRLFMPGYLAAFTGMRRGEVLALAWSDVTLPDKQQPDAGGTITVRRAWDRLESAGGLTLERYRLKAPKNGKERTVDVGPDVVAVLRAHKAAQAALRLEASAWYTGADKSDGTHLEWGELVVTNGNGFPWWPDSFSSAWHTYCADAGVVCRFHDLRGTSGSLSLASGTDAEVVRQRLGHKDAAFFLKYYARPMRAAEERDAGIMNGIAARVPTQTGTKSGHQHEPEREVVAAK